MLIHDQTKIALYYQALLDKNKCFVGTFYVGVKTTSIFCIATCTARKPKLENVDFYTTLKAVLDHAYRPCKVCQPTLNTHQTTAMIERAIKMVKAHPKQKISDYTLRQNDIKPETLRSWFKQKYDMTFHTYQRMYRINMAYIELKKGKHHSNIELKKKDSLYGFSYTYPKASKKKKEKAVILINRITTPLGSMFVAATDKGLCLLEFVDRRMLETEFKDLQSLLNANILIGKNEIIKQTTKEINEYFNGQRQQFEVPIDSPGTAFQNLVWEQLRKIPFGTTLSYQQQAEKIDKPKAVRALASANGYNRISIIVPCHRLIGKDGQLKGYGGGLERKAYLLAHEKKHA